MPLVLWVWINLHTQVSQPFGPGFPEGFIHMVDYLMSQRSNTRQPKMKPVKITIVMTAAAAVLVIGLLMAPEKGIELKRKIREGVHDWYDEFSKLLYTDL